MKTSLRAGAVATAVLFTSACVDHFTIPTSQLQYLNGYDIHTEQNVNGVTFTDRPYRLISTTGQTVDYNSSAQLLILGDNKALLAPYGPYEGIYINQGSFDVIPLGGGPPVQVPLENIKSVQIEKYSPSKTAELTGFIGLLASVALIAMSVVLASSHNNSVPALGDAHTPNAPPPK